MNNNNISLFNIGNLIVEYAYFYDLSVDEALETIKRYLEFKKIIQLL